MACAILPNGDYYEFLNHDLSMGTFDHPWEQTLCVFNEPLIARLGDRRRPCSV